MMLAKKQIKGVKKNDREEHPLSLDEEMKNDQDKTRSLCEQVFVIPDFFSEEGFKTRFFETPDLINLSSVSRTFYSVTKPILNQQKLLTHVVLGQQAEAEMMIKANPELLLVKSIAIDHSKRKIIATPLQAALGGVDEPMWKMILQYMTQDEAFKQCQEWFPNGVKKCLTTKKPSIDYYRALVTRIGSNELNHPDKNRVLIENFRKNLTSKNKIITQELHYNLGHVVAAHTAYVNFLELHLDVAGIPSAWDLVWQQVIGYTQRQMPVYYAQAYCAGIRRVLDEGENAFNRSLQFADGNKFFPLRDNAGLGFDFACQSYIEMGMRDSKMQRSCLSFYTVESCGELVEKLWKNRTAALVALEESLNPNLENRSGCF